MKLTERFSQFKFTGATDPKEIDTFLSDLTKFETESNLAKEDHETILTNISQKLSKMHKECGEDEMLNILALMRATIMDHFVLAYLAETGCTPKQVKLIQQVGQDGVEFWFERNTGDILL